MRITVNKCCQPFLAGAGQKNIIGGRGNHVLVTALSYWEVGANVWGMQRSAQTSKASLNYTSIRLFAKTLYRGL